MSKSFAIILAASLLILPAISSAQTQGKCTQDANQPGTEYCLLAPIPIGNPQGPVTEKTSTGYYLPGLYKLLVALSTGLAVILLMYAGLQYMSTDAFSGKEEAKNTIQNALWGLFLVMGSWLIIYTINPAALDFNLIIPVHELKTAATEKPGIPDEGSGYTPEQVRKILSDGGVGVDGSIQLAGLRQGTIDEVITLKRECNCIVTVTSATGGGHADGQFDHAGGYKVDLRSSGSGESLTKYITEHFTEKKPRNNGDKVYESPAGAIYVWETHRPANAGSQWAPHWDVTVGG